ncbi:MAG: N-acetyltransferase [Deltaproteobacteria bacterium]|nr:N-acetyltransferase [Deltaproteobacteria bacterium]
MSLVLRKAHSVDVAPMHALIVAGAEKGLLLPRSRGQLYTALRDFFVFVDEPGGALAGCCALALIAENLAEVRSLYVSDAYRRQGLGLKLVNACLEDAAAFGISQVFTLTFETAFFSSAGFTEVPKETLPQKIWTDCIHCPKFPNCDEIAMIRSV